MKIKLIPLLFFNLYFLMTILTLEFGPIDWRMPNKSLLYTYIIAYLIAFSIGYLFQIRLNQNTKTKSFKKQKNKFSPIALFFLGSLSIAAALISQKNLSVSNSIVPFNFFSDLFTGIENPAYVYYRKLDPNRISAFHTNLSLSVFYALIIPAKFLFPTYLLTHWESLKWRSKSIGTFISILPIFIGVANGTNKPIFDVLAIYLISLFLLVLARPIYQSQKIKFATYRTPLITLTLITLFSFFYFNHAMNSRTHGNGAAAFIEYLEKSKTPTKDIKVKAEWGNNSFLTFGGFNLIAISMSNYLVEGLYGMSLSIQEPFDTSYGIGHSNFLLHSFNKHLGINLFERTYQRKLNTKWNENASWHSAFTQWANDISFIGVIPLMLIFGYLVATIYQRSLQTGSSLSLTLCFFFFMMFIFMPANNQIFNMLETFFAFWICLFSWFFLNYKRCRPQTHDTQ